MSKTKVIFHLLNGEKIQKTLSKKGIIVPSNLDRIEIINDTNDCSGKITLKTN